MNENWEVNLLVGDGDVEGYNKFPLVYVTSTQERYKLDQNVGQITGQQPIILEHVGDVNAPIPARMVEANKQGQWRLSVYDDVNATPAWDDIFNNTSILTRHFSGATSTAARHTVNGTAKEVRVQIIPEGATNATYYTVQSGYADTSRSYWTPESQQSDGTISQRGAWFIPIFFTFEDSGKGDPFTLRNDLASSPHMIEDSNSDGLPDGWGLVNTPTVTINTNNWLVGGQSISVSGNALNGVDSPTVTATTPDIAAYVWISIASGSATIDFRDSTGSVQSYTLTATDSNNVSDRSILSSVGAKWWRVSYAATMPGNNPYIRVLCGVTTSAIRIDAAYLQTGTTTIPDGWCSSSQLKNRYDPTSTSAATRQQINYLDVWGIPGDLPAIIDYSLLGGGTVPAEDGFIMASLSDGNNLVTDWLHMIDSANSILSSTGTTTADASRIGGSYERFSANGSLVTVDPLGGIGTTGFGDWLSNVSTRVYVIARSSDITNILRLSWDLPGSGINDSVSFDTANTWELLDLGLLNVTTDSPRSIVMFDVIVSIKSGTLDIDALVFLPAQDEKLVIVPTSQGVGLSPFFTSWGDGEYILHARSIGAQTYAPQIQFAGGLWEIYPGNNTNRLILTTVGNFSGANEQEIDIAATTEVELTVTPRTSHLLGTA